MISSCLRTKQLEELTVSRNNVRNVFKRTSIHEHIHIYWFINIK